MMNELLKTQVILSTLATPTGSGGPVVLTSTGDKFIFTPGAPVRLLKWGVIVQTDLVPVTQCLLSLSKRPTAGSDTSRAVIDTLRTGTSAAYVAGKGIYRDPYTASSSATTTDEPSGFGPLGTTAPLQYSGQAQIVLKPGEEWVVDVTTAATTTGKGYIFIEYVLLPISKPSGYGTTDAGTGSLTENLTRVAS